MEVLLACVLFYCVMIYFLTLTFITQQSKSAIVGIRNLSRETSKIVLAKYIKSPFNCKKDILIFNSNKYKGDKKRKNKFVFFGVCVFFFLQETALKKQQNRKDGKRFRHTSQAVPLGPIYKVKGQTCCIFFSRTCQKKLK